MYSRRAQIQRKSPASRPLRDVLAALVLKGALLAVLYVLFFGPAHHSPVDAAATAKALVGAGPSEDVP